MMKSLSMTEQSMELTKLIDLINVPEEDFDNFVTDLKMWLAGHRLMAAIADDLGGNETVSVSETMTWINDGAHDMNITLSSKP